MPQVLRCFSSPAYFAVLPAGHVFPMHKFPHTAQLVGNQRIGAVIDPGMVSDAELLRVHTRRYVDSVRNGAYDELTALRLGLPWHPTISTRAHAATAGTIAAMRAAMQDGIACNLAGGTHHAFADRGEGFCVFNDVAVAVRALQRDEPMTQVMIVDLDAHQGNGTNDLLGDDANVFTFDVHVGRNYPSRKVAATRDVPLPRFASGQLYLQTLAAELPGCVEAFEPDIVFYNAGVDVHVDDRFGQLCLSTAEMAQRDRFTIGLLRRWSIPTVVVYGGGYNRAPGVTAALHVQTIRIAAEFSGQQAAAQDLVSQSLDFA